LVITINAENDMGRNTSISLGEHFDGFISEQIQSGRYGSASEVVRAGLRLLESEQQKLDALRQLLIEGELSGDAEDYDIDTIINALKTRQFRKT
jgi:antitoxin ParD1/3/4